MKLLSLSFIHVELVTCWPGLPLKRQTLWEKDVSRILCFSSVSCWWLRFVNRAGPMDMRQAYYPQADQCSTTRVCVEGLVGVIVTYRAWPNSWFFSKIVIRKSQYTPNFGESCHTTSYHYHYHHYYHHSYYHHSCCFFCFWDFLSFWKANQWGQGSRSCCGSLLGGLFAFVWVDIRLDFSLVSKPQKGPKKVFSWGAICLSVVCARLSYGFALVVMFSLCPFCSDFVWWGGLQWLCGGFLFSCFIVCVFVFSDVLWFWSFIFVISLDGVHLLHV